MVVVGNAVAHTKALANISDALLGVTLAAGAASDLLEEGLGGLGVS